MDKLEENIPDFDIANTHKFLNECIRNSIDPKHIVISHTITPLLLSGHHIVNLLYTSKAIETITFQKCQIRHVEGFDFRDGFINDKLRFEECNFNGCTFYESQFTKDFFLNQVWRRFFYNRTPFDPYRHGIPTTNHSFLLQNTIFTRCDLTGVNFEKSHLKNVEFVGNTLQEAIFKEAFLHNVTFSSAIDLTNADFSNASIIGSTFSPGTSLRGVSFQNAHLHSTSFSKNGDAYSLSARALVGSDLLGTALPSYLNNMQPILDAEAEAAKHARNLFIILAPLCFLVFSILLFADQSQEAIPFMGIKFKIGGFLTAASMAITGVYIYFHLYLQKIWNQCRYLPAVFPNGVPLWDRISPWMFHSLIWEHFISLENTPKKPLNLRWQRVACLFFGYVAPVLLVEALFTKLMLLAIREVIPISEFIPLAVCTGTSLAFILLTGIHFLLNIKKSMTR